MLTTAPTGLQLRWMIRRDMPEVLAIEEACFDWNAWTEDDFIRCLRQRNCIGMVVDKDERVVGFMIYELNRTKLTVLNMAVHPTFTRQGVGTAMVQKLVGKLSTQRRSMIDLDCWENNLSAHLFLKAMGFKATGVVQKEWGEAYRFEYRI